MSNNENIEQNLQWFIITAIGGKEDSIIDALREKIHNFNYDEYVRTIRVFKDKIVKEEIFDKTDQALPKNLKNTKNVTWQTLPNGKYKKVKIKIVNKFPGYVFINMIMNPEVWYAIRNTPGVLGFVGSSGRGAMPIPITIEEYRAVENQTSAPSTTSTSVNETAIPAAPQEEVKKIYTTNLQVGNTVEITSGSFAGLSGVIKHLDNTKGQAGIELEMFGRITIVDIKYNELKSND